MKQSPLISVEELEKRLSDPGVRIFDCRFSLKDPDQGIAQYRQGHIPGAFYAHLDHDLSDLSIPHAGRHPLPDRARFIAWLESRGVSNDTMLVCYDAAGGAVAARLWWMARWAGVADSRLLDGGLNAWVDAGHALDTNEPQTSPGQISKTAAERTCDLDEVEAIAAGRSDLLLLDARDPARFAGENEPLDPVAGHIPHARNAPLGGNLGPDKRFLPPDELRSRFESLASGKDPMQIVHMCGSGVTACHNILAMEVAGLNGSRLFPGSFSQWVDDRARPVATGEGT